MFQEIHAQNCSNIRLETVKKISLIDILKSLHLLKFYAIEFLFTAPIKILRNICVKLYVIIVKGFKKIFIKNY